MKAELASYFDGYIYESPLDFESQLEKIGKQVEGLSESVMEEQIYKKFEYRVCPACRDNIDNFLTPEG